MKAGLCDSCIHKKIIRSERGPEFLLCELSKTDPRFRKYPPLPVLVCDGYRRLVPNNKDQRQ